MKAEKELGIIYNYLQNALGLSRNDYLTKINKNYKEKKNLNF